jgi:ketosteroid isomerase-like protein
MGLESEKEKLLQHDAEWAALTSGGKDIEGILSYWTDDAVVIPPDLPVIIGKTALREYVQASLQIPGFSISWKSSDATLSPDGRLAYMFGDNRVTMNGPDGKLMTIPGRGVTIWRKEPDGAWRCAVDIWNGAPAAARS